MKVQDQISKIERTMHECFDKIQENPQDVYKNDKNFIFLFEKYISLLEDYTKIKYETH